MVETQPNEQLSWTIDHLYDTLGGQCDPVADPQPSIDANNRLRHQKASLGVELTNASRLRRASSHHIHHQFVIEHEEQFERFVIVNDKPRGRGTWGAVFWGVDRLLNAEVAIKIFLPNEHARKQMEYQKLSPTEAFRKGIRRRYSSSNLIITEWHRTAQGREFIVMSRYDQFFDEILREAVNREHNPQAFASGLTALELTSYANDIFTGIHDFHVHEKRAHADIKPDNIAVCDRELLLADFGSATCVKTPAENPRDHKGHQYIRAPSQFFGDAHPTIASDLFSVSSNIYRMFVPEFLFQEEVDTLSAQGPATLDSWMQEFHNGKHRDTLEKKLEKIPKEFYEFFTKSASEDWTTAKEAQTAFNEAVRQKYGIVIGQTAKDKQGEEQNTGRQKRQLWKFGAAGILAGALASIPIYFHPEHLLRGNLQAQITIISAENSNLRLETEQQYGPVVKATTRTDHHCDERWVLNRKESLAHIFADMYMKTAGELQYNIDKEILQKRAQTLSENKEEFKHYRDALEYVAEYAIGSNTIENRVDLEDAAYVVHLGNSSITTAWQLAHSAEFSKYARFAAKLALNPQPRSYTLVAAPHEEKFVRQFIYNITQALPAKVHLKSDSSRSE